MSYILEALKKSERERQTDEIPTISPYNTTSAAQSKQAAYQTGIIIALFAVAFAALAYWKLDSNSTHQDPALQAQPQPQPQTQPQIQNQTPPQIQPSLTQEQKTPAIKPPALSTSAPQVSKAQVISSQPRASIFSEASPLAHTNAISLFDMPNHFQQQIPALHYASHWYAAKPQSRNVIINNRSLKEGDWINASIQIREIAQHHVTLKSQQTLFSLPALESWQP